MKVFIEKKYYFPNELVSPICLIQHLSRRILRLTKGNIQSKTLLQSICGQPSLHSEAWPGRKTYSKYLRLVGTYELESQPKEIKRDGDK